MDLELLLAHADDHEPVLEAGLPLDSVAKAPKPAGDSGPEHLRSDSSDPNVLSLQRWGIIAPEGALGDRLLALIEPLRRARQQQQGGMPVQVYRVPTAMSADDAVKWKNHEYWNEEVAEDDIPRYLLILGDLDRVSLTLQQALASDTFVGRLAFRSERDYEAYVDKVLRLERTPRESAQARALFYTVRDGTAATSIGYRALMAPSVAQCRERKEKGGFPAKEILEVGADLGGSTAELLRQASTRDPSVLFSISHGLGAPRGGWRSASEQQALQGAMSLGQGQRLTAGDLGEEPFLPGGVWFFLACYGAGTPDESAYYHWLDRLRKMGQFGARVDSVLAGLPRSGDLPFVAALPQAALANPEGPIAVIGHIDLAWTYSFQDMTGASRGRPSRFQGVFRSLVEGARAGVAYHELLRFFSETNMALSTLYDEEARAESRPGPPRADRSTEKAHLWMLRNDLSGYILLGDPAVQMLSAPAATAETRRTPSNPLRQLIGFLEDTTKEPDVRSKSPSAPDLEEAVLRLLLGDSPEATIAARHGVSRDELRRSAEAYREAGRAALIKLG